MPSVLIRKSDGSLEPFSSGKLLSSLQRAGAERAVADRIVAHIEGELTQGMTTSSIYKHAFSFLKRHAQIPAIKYSMRRAVLSFGPSGYPFEDYVSELLRARGFSTRTRVIMKGTCVEHEVDVVIDKPDGRISVEAKFHNVNGIKSDVKVALYVSARVEDLRKEKENRLLGGWLVTNTKFTAQAIEYGVCAGLTLIGWDYPEKGNLNDLINEAGLYPLTALTTLTPREAHDLLALDIVLCRDVPKHEKVLRDIGIPPVRIAKIFEEISLLCGGGRRVQ